MTKLKHYDIGAIKDRLEAEEICDKIGLRRKGKQCQCPDPTHDDRNFGNCLIKPYGCYCFACKKKFDKFDMVQASLNLSFYEALETMASWCGIEGDSNVPPAKKKFPLTEEEIELLGLLPDAKTVSGICGITPWEPNKKSEKRVRDPHGDVYCLSNKTFSLKQLFWEDEEMFRQIVLGKAKEKLKDCNESLKICPTVMRKPLSCIRNELLNILSKVNRIAA